MLEKEPTMHYQDEATKVTKKGEKWVVEDGGDVIEFKKGKGVSVKEKTEQEKVSKQEEKAVKGPKSKEWKEHFGPMAELQEKREFKEKMAKGRNLREWAAGYGGEYQGAETGALGEELTKEQESVKQAKIPENKPDWEQILELAGINPDAKPEVASQKAQDLIENQGARQDVLDKLWEKAEESSKRIYSQFAEKADALNKRENIFLSVFKKGKEVAVKGGKILAAAGLSPFAALEIIGQEAVGRFQVETGEKKQARAIAGIQETDEARRARGEKLGPIMKEYYYTKYKNLFEASGRATDSIISGEKKIEKKGFLLKTFEKLFFNRKEKDTK